MQYKTLNLKKKNLSTRLEDLRETSLSLKDMEDLLLKNNLSKEEIILEFTNRVIECIDDKNTRTEIKKMFSGLIISRFQNTITEKAARENNKC